MSLSEEYRRQYGWRSWPTILDALPRLAGQTVLDLGCAVGDQAAELVARGARVIGVDANEELLEVARATCLSNAEFRKGDLASLPDIETTADGIWCSFTAAYFPDLPTALKSWAKHLRPGGWLALTEMDDLFGHEPLGVRAKSLLDHYARDALLAGRYDFRMGRKLAGYLAQSGFMVQSMLMLKDQELSFDGPATAEVIDAWRARFDRMRLLRDFCGSDFEPLRGEFLQCLTSVEHKSQAKVYCSLAVKR